MGRLASIYAVGNEFIPFFLNPYELAVLALGEFVEAPILENMASSQIGTDRDGLFVDVRTPGGLPVCMPQVQRAVNFRVSFEQADRFIDDPQNYEKPERLRGRGRGVPADEDGGPGYLPYHRVEFTTDGFRVYSDRPYHPILSREAHQELASWVNEWVAAGVLPHNG